MNLNLNSHTRLTSVVDSAGLKYVILLVSILTLENGTYYGIKSGHGIYKFNSFFTPWATENIFKDQDNNCVFAYLIRHDELLSLDLSVWADYKLIFIYVLNPISGEDIFRSPVLYLLLLLSETEIVY